MEELDVKKVARVWSRVRGESEVPDLQQMLDLSRTAAFHCDMLARKYTGNRHRILHQIARQNQNTVESLLGICALSGCHYAAQMPKIPDKPARQQLLDCYNRLLQLSVLFGTHAANPQFGYFYSQLEQQAKVHCQKLLQLLGTTF